MLLGMLILALLPLLALAIGITVQAMPAGLEGLEGLEGLIFSLSFIGAYLIVLLGLLWGWLSGFPRWVYPYLTYSIFFALYLFFVSTPGFAIFGIPMWNREMWGWRAFVPLALTAVVALLLSKERLAPLLKLVKDVWNDWTLLAYGAYGLLPLLVPIILDETDHSYRFPITAVSAALMVIGAALYLGLPKTRLRTALLLGGLFLSLLAASLGSDLYWKTHDVNMVTYQVSPIAGPIPWGRIIPSALSGSVNATLALLLAPALVAFASYLERKQRRSSS